MHATLLQFTVPALAACSLAAQQDLRVPSAYPDVATAIQAASPGDRVLLEEGAVAHAVAGFGDLIVDKSLTIESDTPGESRTLGLSALRTSIGGRLLVTQLDGGIPLVLRDVTLEFWQMGSYYPPPLGIRIDTPGEVRMENVSLGFATSQIDPTLLADVDTTSLWMHGCTLMGHTPQNGEPCPDPFDPNGGDALRVTADLLILEDCLISGGDASYLYFSSMCNPPRVKGNGGYAVQADTATSIITRCQIRDGNGSWFEPGPWISVPSTVAGTSSFVASGGTLISHGLTHETGLAGQVGPKPTSHGITLYPGQYYAPVQMDGNRLGGQTTVRVSLPSFYPDPGALLFALAWGPTPTPFGPLSSDASAIAVALPVPFPTIASLRFNVPAIAALANTTFLAELLTLSGSSVTVWNASGVSLAH